MLTGVLREVWAPRKPKRTWEHLGLAHSAGNAAADPDISCGLSLPAGVMLPSIVQRQQPQEQEKKGPGPQFSELLLYCHVFRLSLMWWDNFEV